MDYTQKSRQVVITFSLNMLLPLKGQNEDADDFNTMVVKDEDNDSEVSCFASGFMHLYHCYAALRGGGRGGERRGEGGGGGGQGHYKCGIN